MTSNLFSRPIIDEYRFNPAIQGALRGVELLTFQEYQAWLQPAQPSRTSLLRPPSGPYDTSGAEERTLRKAVEVLAENVCHDEISSSYLDNTIKRTIDTPGEYSLLVAVAPGYKEAQTLTARGTPFTYPERAAENKMEYVLGFIVAQLGECALEPNVWVVNLICTRSSMGHSIKGTILMGAYLYCIKRSGPPIEKIGKLELAGGPGNPNGYFSYIKSGFNIDFRLYSAIPKCFVDAENLPMEVNLDKFDYQEIIGMAIGAIQRQEPVTITWPFGQITGDFGFFELGYPERGNKLQENTQRQIGKNIMTLYKLILIKFLYAQVQVMISRYPIIKQNFDQLIIHIKTRQILEVYGDPNEHISDDADENDGPELALLKKFIHRYPILPDMIDNQIENIIKEIRRLKNIFNNQKPVTGRRSSNAGEEHPSLLEIMAEANLEFFKEKFVPLATRKREELILEMNRQLLQKARFEKERLRIEEEERLIEEERLRIEEEERRVEEERLRIEAEERLKEDQELRENRGEDMVAFGRERHEVSARLNPFKKIRNTSQTGMLIPTRRSSSLVGPYTLRRRKSKYPLLSRKKYATQRGGKERKSNKNKKRKSTLKKKRRQRRTQKRAP
jgi:hypothetical protein